MQKGRVVPRISANRPLRPLGLCATNDGNALVSGRRIGSRFELPLGTLGLSVSNIVFSLAGSNVVIEVTDCWLANKMASEIPNAPSSRRLNWPSVTYAVEKSIHVSPTKILSPYRQKPHTL